MRIHRIHVKNFKKFVDQDFDFNPRFTLLVGENGSGKTSVLDALSVAAGIWLVEPPDSKLANSGRNIENTEIRLEGEGRGDRIQFIERRPVMVRAMGELAGQQVKWTRQIREDGRRTSNAEAGDALQIVRQVYQQDAQGEKVLCPVLAYYGAGRAWLPSNQRVPKAKGSQPARRWDAFYDCFSERIRFAELQKWFVSETVERGNRAGRSRPGFEAVRRAILRCVPGADDVFFSTDLDQIVLSLNGIAQPFDNLSAGQRMMLALVADLAIKAVTQNAFLLPADDLEGTAEDLPRVLVQSPGLVLIDELDVHLHPKWQRRAASDLKQTFPNFQFVCTSHSPQVIGELHPAEVRLLNSEASTTPAQSYGMDSNWIIEVLMQGDERNPIIKAELIHLFQLIQNKQLDTAQEEIRRLRAEVGNSDSLQRAESLVQRIKILGK